MLACSAPGHDSLLPTLAVPRSQSTPPEDCSPTMQNVPQSPPLSPTSSTPTTRCDDPEIDCSLCSSPASLLCKKCLVTSYCSSECQKYDWTEHKPICRILCTDALPHGYILRLTDFLASAWLEFRATTFDINITAFRADEDKLFVTEGGKGAGMAPTGFGCVWGVPEHLVETKKDKEAVLCARGSGDAVALLTDILDEVLDESEHIAAISEHVSFINNQPRPVHFASLDAELIEHTTLKVTLRTSEVYAIDVTAAQFGFTTRCLSWADFLSTRAPSNEYINHLGNYQQALERLTEEHRGKSGLGPQHLFREGFEQMGRAWCAQQGMGYKDLLALPAEEYLHKKKDFLVWQVMMLKSYMADMDAKYPNPAEDERLTWNTKEIEEVYEED